MGIFDDAIRAAPRPEAPPGRRRVRAETARGRGVRPARAPRRPRFPESRVRYRPRARSAAGARGRGAEATAEAAAPPRPSRAPRPPAEADRSSARRAGACRRACRPSRSRGRSRRRTATPCSPTRTPKPPPPEDEGPVEDEGASGLHDRGARGDRRPADRVLRPGAGAARAGRARSRPRGRDRGGGAGGAAGSRRGAGGRSPPRSAVEPDARGRDRGRGGAGAAAGRAVSLSRTSLSRSRRGAPRATPKTCSRRRRSSYGRIRTTTSSGSSRASRRTSTSSCVLSRSAVLDVAAGAGGVDDALDADQVGGLAQVEALFLGRAATPRGRTCA